MKVAFVIYNGMTTLDFIGVYDPLTRLKTMKFLNDFEWEICSISKTVRDTTGLCILPTRINKPFYDYDLVYVPGGYGSRSYLNDKEFINWLKTAKDCDYKVSVCTGSLLLGAVGFLYGKKATTHPTEYEMLKPYCSIVLDQRIVDEGDVITARGVTSAIDLGLYLCEKFAGSEAKEKIRKQMDYPF